MLVHDDLLKHDKSDDNEWSEFQTHISVVSKIQVRYQQPWKF